MFDIEPLLMFGWYGAAVILGIVLFRRSRVVKDHEYNRAKAMRKIRHVYEAEERGIWQKETHLDGNIDAATAASLGRSIGELSGEGPEMELGDDEKVEVQMLAEADHIVKANARVTGERTLDDERITGTVGATQSVGQWTDCWTVSGDCLASTVVQNERPSVKLVFNWLHSKRPSLLNDRWRPFVSTRGRMRAK